MATASPWPETATADELGALLNISGRRVRELASEGTFARAVGGRYVVLSCVHAYLDTLRAATKAKSTPDPDVVAAVLDGRRERARLAKAMADKAELDLAERREELVNAHEVRVHLSTMIVTTRNQLMGVPSHARGRLPHLTIADVIVLEELQAEALENLVVELRRKRNNKEPNT